MYMHFSVNFLPDLFPHLLRILAPSLVMQLLINIPSSYFHLMDNFTGLIEFLPGVIWSLYYAWQKQDRSLQFRQILITCYVTLWSIRLGSFLFYRMICISPTDGRIVKLSKKYGQLALFAFWLGPHGFWSVICCLPVALLHAFPILENRFTIIDFIGSIVWLCGFLLETFADWHKLQAKLVGKKMYYHPNFLWNYSRNPNHCGEVLCWFGLSIISSNLVLYHFLYQYNIPIIILLMISPLFTLLIMLYEATLISELSNNKRFNSQIDYHQYRKQTSLLWPILPKIYLHLPKWIKQILFFEWNMYNKGLKQAVS